MAARSLLTAATICITLAASAYQVFVAPVVRVESDFGWPNQQVHLTFEVPCEAVVDRYIHYETQMAADQPKVVSIGLLLRHNPTPHCAYPGQKQQIRASFQVPHRSQAKIQIIGAEGDVKVKEIY